MFNQKLLFPLLFISLGAMLGWFSHSAFNKLSFPSENQLVPVRTSEKPVAKITENNSEKNTPDEFSVLLTSGQYEKALIVYKNNISNKGTAVHLAKSHQHVLLLEIAQLQKQSRTQQLQLLLSVFLKEYYQNVDLLLKQAEIHGQTGQYESAINSFYQAKNYAAHNQELLAISQKIYGFAHGVYKQISESEDWPRGVKLFEQFISFETEYPFFHLALADFHIRLDNVGQAISHLQLLAEDPQFGNKASDMLQTLYVNENQSGIELKRHNEHYMVNVLLSDIYQVELMIDTGASLTVLAPELLRRLELEGLASRMGSNQLYTAGGQVEADVYKVSKLSIGNYAVDNIAVAELNLEQPDNTQKNIDGLLGMSFLNQFNFAIDQENHLLLLTPK